MEKINFILGICVLLMLVSALTFVMCHEMIGEIRALRKVLKRDLSQHQEWLFDQLYSMAPGKVLKPDEIEPEEVSKPAVVIHPSRDPMNEFNGKKNDWD